MAALFGHSNPLTTPVGQLIERATDGTQASENWALYMEVCDLINETDDGPKDASKAIRKRLSQNMGKNNTAVLYTLTCLETCVKNCGRRFHTYIGNKDFLNDMVKVIGPKYDPPQAVQEKVLSMIQTWADAFRGSPELKDVEKVYQDLKSKGIEFPMTDLDHLAPIHTPARTTGGVDPEPPIISRSRGSTTNRSASVRSQGVVLGPAPQSQMPPQMPQQMPQQMPPQMPPQMGMGPAGVPAPGHVSQEHLAKLRSELDVVQGNVRVMSEMLTELTPSTVVTSDLELLQELNRTNRQMQQRIVDLLDGVPNEEVTNELLRVNDDLNNVFLRYERFERYRTGQPGQPGEEELASLEPVEPAPAEFVAPPSYDDSVQTSNPNVVNLIDLGDDTTTTSTVQATNGIAAMNVGTAGQEDGFDMFAQSRQSFDQNKENLGGAGGYVNKDQVRENLGQAVNVKAQLDPSSGQTEEDMLKSLQLAEFDTIERIRKLQDKDTDYDEMEQWLSTQEAQQQAGQARKEESISSSEFDSFLQDRASAASNLPTISAQTAPTQNRQGNRARQLGKDDDDNPLFAL